MTTLRVERKELTNETAIKRRLRGGGIKLMELYSTLKKRVFVYRQYISLRLVHYLLSFLLSGHVVQSDYWCNQLKSNHLLAKCLWWRNDRTNRILFHLLVVTFRYKQSTIRIERYSLILWIVNIDHNKSTNHIRKDDDLLLCIVWPCYN